MSDCNKKVILIDDDPCNNFIFKTTLKRLCKPFMPVVKDFTSPVAGLQYMEQDFVVCQEPVILFLDINMPVLNGWEVLSRLNQLPEISKRLLTLYMFSSSISLTDKQKAAENPLVKDYIEKPLSVAMEWLKGEIFGTTAAVA